MSILDKKIENYIFGDISTNELLIRPMILKFKILVKQLLIVLKYLSL